jgi:phage shock protein PspC (stress-responsive transcriptional regulator)
MRALHLTRQRGWIGGVCAGIADRLGIDPIIVRGIAVVVAVLGGPALLLYAAAWLLLPDADDRIHLERLTRGDFDPANIGIGALVVLSLLPVTQGFWYLGASYWSEPYWAGSLGRALWTVLLLGAAVVAIIWIARRARQSSPEPTVTPATTDARPETVPQPPTAAAEVAVATTVAEVADDAPVPPAHPAADAPPEDLAAWREQQERWKSEHAAWKQQQAASARELRDQRAAENHARAMANAAAADERRRLRRLANPRITGSHVAITLGAALLVGGIAAILSQSGDGWHGYGVVVGLAAASIVVALSAIAAGLLRRRSGFLGFVSLVLVASTVAVSFIPPDRTLVGAGAGVSIEKSARYAQPAGSFSVYSPHDSAPAGSSTIDLWQGAGDVYIQVPDGTAVRVVADLGSRNLERSRYVKATKAKASDPDSWDYVDVRTSPTRTAAGRYAYDFTVGSGAPTATVRIWQGEGRVRVEQQQPEETGVTQ